MKKLEAKQPAPRRRKARVSVTDESGAQQVVDRDVIVTGPEADARGLLAQLAPVYAQHVEFYAKEYAGAPNADAKQMADDYFEYARGEVPNTPPEKISWRDLSAVAQKDLGAALELWEGVKQAAREELAIGSRTLGGIAPNATPFQRAQHIALREEMTEGWQPQNGIEHALIDMLATTFGLWLHWTEIAHSWATGFVEKTTRDTYAETHGWKPMRISEAESIDRAHRIADGYNRQFLRVLRQLRDLRRYAPSVIVNNGGQVNLANQQMNLSVKS